VRVGHQSQDCQGDRPYYSRNFPGARRRGDRMRRRDFITVVGAAAAAWPLAARAQRPGKLPPTGILGPDPSLWTTWTAALVQRLRELGWIDGSTITLEYRWAGGNPSRYAEIAAEFIRLNVDVIVTTGTAVSALRRATSTIPIVFAISLDPIGG